METAAVVKAWGLILRGYRPNLSIEITRECPLRCPGCYAYGDTHLGGDVVLRELADFKGQELIDGVLDLVGRYRPLHLSIVGGEPLVRFRELEVLLPKLTGMGVHVQVVTSAVRPIPESWADMPLLQVCVSIDGLQPEHDVRRAPATYDRILKHIKGQHVTVHCTITRQQSRAGLRDGVHGVLGDAAGRQAIWFSLYTPQKGEQSEEMLRREDRAAGRRGDHVALRARAEAARHDPVGGERLPRAAAESRRVHLREDDGVRVVGLEAADHAVPVRRRSRLHAVRLHGVGRARGGWRVSARWRPAAPGDLQCVAQGRARRARPRRRAICRRQRQRTGRRGRERSWGRGSRPKSPRCDRFRGCAPVAQLDRAPGFEPVGRGFKSLRARHRLCSCTEAPRTARVIDRTSNGLRRTRP